MDGVVSTYRVNRYCLLPHKCGFCGKWFWFQKANLYYERYEGCGWASPRFYHYRAYVPEMGSGRKWCCCGSRMTEYESRQHIKHLEK